VPPCKPHAKPGSSSGPMLCPSLAQSAARLRMHGLAFIEASSPLPGAAFSSDGRVRKRSGFRVAGRHGRGALPAHAALSPTPCHTARHGSWSSGKMSR
jgi:hypothetical protein